MNGAKELDWAIRFAIAYYSNHYSNGMPKILHPLRVMNACQNFSIDHAIVGIFHNILNDFPKQRDSISSHIKEKFGLEISTAIELITYNSKVQKYDDYIKLIAKNEMTRLVKLADITDNLSHLHELPKEQAKSLYHIYFTAKAYLLANFN